MLSSETILLPSASRTVTGIGDLVTLERTTRPIPESGVGFLNITAVSGTSPTLDVFIHRRVSGVDIIFAAFAQQTAVGSAFVNISNCLDVIGITYVIGGTSPDFTFEVVLVR